MNKLKRLCRVCGAANALEVEICPVCGTDLSLDVPAPIAEDRQLVPWKKAGTGLAISAGLLALRVGLELAQSWLDRRASRPAPSRPETSLPLKIARWLGRPGTTEEPPQPEPRIRGWARRMRGRWRGGRSDWEVEEFYWEVDR